MGFAHWAAWKHCSDFGSAAAKSHWSGKVISFQELPCILSFLFYLWLAVLLNVHLRSLSVHLGPQVMFTLYELLQNYICFWLLLYLYLYAYSFTNFFRVSLQFLSLFVTEEQYDCYPEPFRSAPRTVKKNTYFYILAEIFVKGISISCGKIPMIAITIYHLRIFVTFPHLFQS